MKLTQTLCWFFITQDDLNAYSRKYFRIGHESDPNTLLVVLSPAGGFATKKPLKFFLGGLCPPDPPNAGGLRPPDPPKVGLLQPPEDMSSWAGMVFHGIPWYSTVYHGIPWIPCYYHAIPWNTMVYHGIPWYTMATWYTMVYHGIPWHVPGAPQHSGGLAGRAPPSKKPKTYCWKRHRDQLRWVLGKRNHAFVFFQALFRKKHCTWRRSAYWSWSTGLDSEVHKLSMWVHLVLPGFLFSTKPPLNEFRIEGFGLLKAQRCVHTNLGPHSFWGGWARVLHVSLCA